MTMLLTIFNILYDDSTFSLNKRMIISITLIFSFVFLEIVLNGIIEIIFPIIIYFVFKRNKIDNYLISIILLSFIIYNFSLAFMTMIISKLVPSNVNSIGIVLLSVSLQLIAASLLVLLLLLLLHSQLRNRLKNQNNVFLNLLLGYSYLIMFFLIIAVQFFEAYTILINGLIIFLLLQCFFIIIIFTLERKRQKKYYSEKLSQEQIKNLKKYTDQLEHDQLSLRRFKHDYKNLLHSLEIDVRNKNYTNLQKYLTSLNKYSDEHLNNISTEIYRDLVHVKVPYLKSLFISKLNKLIQKNIEGTFECAFDLNNVSINEFDVIRLLGITLDNAIEETENIDNGKIFISVINSKENTTFIIKNTSLSNGQPSDLSLPGYTTKKNHLGLGLSTVYEIQKKYSNLLINYSNKNNYFEIQIILMKESINDNDSTNM